MQVETVPVFAFFELEAELGEAHHFLPLPLCRQLEHATRSCSRMYPFPLMMNGVGMNQACSIGDCRDVFTRTVLYITEQARPHYGTDDPEQRLRVDDMLWLRSKVLRALVAIH